MELNHVMLAVADISRSAAFYERLGFTRIVDAPGYIRFECRPGGSTLSLQLTERSAPADAIVIYFECDDLDARVSALRAAGIQFETDPADQPWLWREAHLRDPDGHRLCLFHAGRHRLHPPWRIQPDTPALVLEGIDHIALAVRDVPAAARWFEDVLGLTRRYQEAWGDYPAVVGTGTTSLALFPVESETPLPRPGRNVLTMRHLAFRADHASFQAAQQALTHRQIPFTFQDHAISHSIYFHDPNGHEIEITTYDLLK